MPFVSGLYITAWASLRESAPLSETTYSFNISRGTNPAFTIPELTSHLRKIKASAIIAHSDVLPVVKAATAQAGLGLDRIVLIDRRDDTGELLSLPQLIQEGKTLDPLPEPRLKAGEGRKRIAFLNTSSGTTGPPKVRSILDFLFSSTECCKGIDP